MPVLFVSHVPLSQMVFFEKTDDQILVVIVLLTSIGEAAFD